MNTQAIIKSTYITISIVSFITFCLCCYRLLSDGLPDIVVLSNSEAVKSFTAGLMAVDSYLDASIANSPYVFPIGVILIAFYFKAALVGSLNAIALSACVLAISIDGSLDFESISAFNSAIYLFADTASLWRSIPICIIVIAGIYSYLTSSLYLFLLPVGLLSLFIDNVQISNADIGLLAISGMLPILLITHWPKNHKPSSTPALA